MHVFTVVLVSVASLSHLLLGCCWHGGKQPQATCTSHHEHTSIALAHNLAVEPLCQEPSPEREPHQCSQHGRCWWNCTPRFQELTQAAGDAGDISREVLAIPAERGERESVATVVSEQGCRALARLGVFLC